VFDQKSKNDFEDKNKEEEKKKRQQQHKHKHKQLKKSGFFKNKFSSLFHITKKQNTTEN
jgi:hypothetical protein